MELKEKLLSSYIAFENQNSVVNSFVNELRGEAIKNFEATGFPSKKNENWKYTSLKKVLNEAFECIFADLRKNLSQPVEILEGNDILSQAVEFQDI